MLVAVWCGFFAAFHARTRFLLVRSRLCACEYAHKANGSAAKCSTGRVSGRSDIAVTSVLSRCFVRITAEMRSNIRRALLYGISFCEVRISNAPRLRCGGNGVAEGDSEE